MKKLILICLLIPFLSTAQIQVSSSFSYAIDKGTGGNVKFAGSGFELSLRKHLTETFRTTATIGAYDMRIALVTVSNFDYLAKTYGYSYKMVVPMTIGGEYYLLSKKLIKPFIGLETGAFYTKYDSQIDPNYIGIAPNLPTGECLNWGFSPSVGVHLQEFADRLGLFLKVKYTGITYSEGYGNLVSFNAGVTFKFGKKIKWKPPVIEVPLQTPYYEKK
jgi:outer membrane receptor protein involved in Fe transport